MTLEDFTEFDDGDEADDVASSSDDTGSAGSAEPGEADGSTDPDRAEASDPPSAESTTPDDELSFERVDAEAAGSDDGIGALSVSRGLRIDDTGDETCLRAYVTAPNRSRIRVGSYLLVPYPDGERLFCRIAGLEYAQEFHSDDATEITARRAMRDDGIEESDYKFLAELDPVAILYEDGELKRRMTDRVPKPRTVVREASDETEIKTGLKIPESGVFLGHLAVGGERVTTAAEPPTIDYRLNDDYDGGDPLLFRHTLVAGGTGSGKTHAAKNVLRQVLDEDRTYALPDGRDRRPGMVIFDPQDEYAQMHDDNDAVTDADRRSWERQGIAHGGHDDTVAFVPKIAGASYDGGGHRAEQVEFTIPFSMVRSRPWLVAGSGLNDNQYQAIARVLLPRFFSQYGDDATYDQFQSFMDDPALKEELDESGKVHEKTFEAVGRRIHGFGHVFDQDARPITEQVRTFVRAGRLSVVPTYHVNDTRAAETVVLAVASLLIDQKLSSDPEYERIKETPLLVGMDEAHNYLTDAESVQARKVIGKFTDAAKQGRKERLGLFLITQDPQDIHDAVFKQINTTIVLNLGDEDAIDSVNIPTKLERKVPYMEQGQMVVYSPDNSDPVELIGLPKCVTNHG